MSKKISLVFILVLTFILGISTISASTCTCSYSSSNLSGTFSVDKSTSKIPTNKINLIGEIANSKDSSSHNINNDYPFDNWNDQYKTISSFKFIGKDYFKSTGFCPSNLYVIDRAGAYAILVSDELNSDVLEFAKKKQGYEILTLHESTTCDGLHSPSSITPASPNPSACIGRSEKTCKPDSENQVSCTWNRKYNFCSTTGLLYTQCGDSYDIPIQAPEIISLVITFLKILTPIVLIIISIISLVKALAASSEDEIKKAQGRLVKRFIAAIMVFLVISIVQFVINKVADDSEKDSISKCLSCLLNNKCEDIKYYRIDDNTCINYKDNSDYPCPEAK